MMRSLPSTTPLGRVFRIQLRSVLSRVGLSAMLTALVVTFVLMVYSLVVRSQSGGNLAGSFGGLSFLVMGHTLVMTVAFFLPGLFWKGLPPRDRRSLHAQPADRRHLEMTRVAAGAVLLLGFSLPVYLLGLLLELRLGNAADPLPSPRAWLLALGAPLLLYLMGSVCGLITTSATSTMIRLVVWGSALAIGAAMLRDRVAVIRAVADAISGQLLTGPFGALTALGAGSRALVGRTGAPEAVALIVWLALAALGVGLSAGRLPRLG